MIPYIKRKEAGFSLIEVAIVLVILGLIMGGMLMPLSAQVEKSRRSATTRQLEGQLEALLGFAITNGRLPCPDINADGFEDPPGGAGGCTALSGEMPAFTLGVGRLDAWGRPFTYRVTNSFADDVDGTGCGTATAGISLELCSSGDIQIRDASGGAPVALGMPLVIVSHSNNWASSLSPDELENSDGDIIFVDRIYSGVAGAEYDDLVVWLTPNILKNRMVTAGRLP